MFFGILNLVQLYKVLNKKEYLNNYKMYMKLPLNIKSDIGQKYTKFWETQFVNTGRTVLEGLWRRTQNVENKERSGWKNSSDMRRRMLHYIDRFDLKKNKSDKYDFVLVAPYLWLSYAFPKSEVDRYMEKLNNLLVEYNWENVIDDVEKKVFKNEDLTLSFKYITRYESDIEENRKFPEDYVFFEITLTGSETKVGENEKKHPWEVLKTGIRTPDKRGNPKIVKETKDLEDFLPMQVELGCGPSIEAEIPPLHYLHKVFYVSDVETGSFILDLEKDNLISDIIRDAHWFFKRSSVLYKSALLSEITDFYMLLGEMKKEGDVVGPIITNNFDGLSSRVGFEEMYMRRYDESHIVPKINFHPDAKSLLVVGSHADRRKVQHSAREQGLQVIYVDPEGFEENGKFIEYPLESVQDSDIHLKMAAGEFAANWRKNFDKYKP